MWEKMPQGNKAQELKAFFNGETEFLRLVLAEVTSVPESVSIKHLQHIARLRLSLNMAVQLISDSLSGER